MRSIQQVASEPQLGDVVVLTTGKIRYEVIVFSLRVGSRQDTYVEAVREETFREEPYVRREKVKIGLAAWEDLVRFSASIVERAPPTSGS